MASTLHDQNTWLPWTAQVFRDDKNDIVVKGPTLAQIVANYREVCRLRGLPIPEDIVQTVTEQICANAPERCSFSDGAVPQAPLKSSFGLKDVKAFIKSVEGTIKGGGVVSQELAEERTNVCMRCPYNTDLPGCSGCAGIANLVFKVIGSRQTANMGRLKQCGICGCSLKAKIWVPQETIKETAQVQRNMDQFPKWCWVNP
jgi:hypothetical protein